MRSTTAQDGDFGMPDLIEIDQGADEVEDLQTYIEQDRMAANKPVGITGLAPRQRGQGQKCSRSRPSPEVFEAKAKAKSFKVNVNEL